MPDATPTPTPTPTPAPGLLEQLRAALAPQYEVERQLGAGGMGSVFLARDVTLDRRVAVKVIAPELAANRTFRDRFLLEARTVARLRHPNIVAVYAAGESAGLLHFVMEYVPGESLRDLLDRETRCEPERARRILRDLAGALAYAHANGIIHRDIKPENILLNEQGSPLLTDFGVARAYSSDTADAGAAPDAGRMTGTGFVLGSPRYMSPEQATGERQLDGRSDIYALGLVGYEMIAGEPTFGAASAGSLIVKQLTERPAPLVTHAPGVPPDLAAAVERALEKDPADRWADAADMARALGGEATPGSPLRASAARGRRRSRVALAAGALALLVALPGAWLLARGRAAPAGVDPRRSFFVAPFEVMAPDPQLQWLREGSVSMLSLNLAQWADLSVVDYERSLDLLRDAELDGKRVGLEDARTIARQAGAWTVVTGQVIGAGDSLTVVARAYDVASGRKLDEATHTAARTTDPRPLYDALARDLLDLVNAPPVTLQLAKTTTTSVAAYRAYLEGSRALNNWQLDAADSLFRDAVAADSTFALAYYRRASTLGWRRAGDPAQLAAVRKANQYAARLPARERDILAAYTDLSHGLHAGLDTAQRDARFSSAQRRYAAVVRRDSSDVEAWFGLGDAYYHHQPDGGPRTVANLNGALRAFDRALALDSTFYLAYSHKLDLYRRATATSSNVALDGDSLRLLATSAERRAFGVDRLARARAEARRLAVRDARAWIAADPVRQAYLLLSLVYGEAGQFDSAAAVVREAQSRPATRSPRFPYLLAGIQARSDPPAALRTLREALRDVDADDIRAEGDNPAEAYETVLAGADAATISGSLRDLDGVVKVAAALEPQPPAGAPRTPRGLRTRWAATRMKLGMGAPAAPLRSFVDSGVVFLDRLEGPIGTQSRQQATSVPYLAYLATRDPRYAATVHRWAGDTAYGELRALAALEAGDTATAAAAARLFPDVDSLRRDGATLNPMRWATRAEVLEALGEPRRALAMYEALEPTSLAGNVGDAGWALYARSFLARGRLYEQLGEREKAVAAYDRFLALWTEADPVLEPQLREAREGLARLRDAGAATEVR